MEQQTSVHRRCILTDPYRGHTGGACYVHGSDERAAALTPLPELGYEVGWGSMSIGHEKHRTRTSLGHCIAEGESGYTVYGDW